MQIRLFYPVIKKFAPFVVTAIIVLLLYKYYGAFKYTSDNLAEFFRLNYEHFFLVIVSMAAAGTVGVFLGIIMTRKGFERFGSAIMAMVNVWQSIPSLGVIALAYGFLPLVGFSGIGVVPALIALFFHAVAPIVRNTYAGVKDVSNDVIESATGMGMTPNQILFKIEIPNARLCPTGFSYWGRRPWFLDLYRYCPYGYGDSDCRRSSCGHNCHVI